MCIREQGKGVGGVYVHIPYCRTRCVYCDFVSSTAKPPLERYTAAVERELAMKQKRLAVYGSDWRGDRPRSIYVGGGTPSLFPACYISRLIDIGRGASSGPVEVTVEVNPADVDEQWFRYVVSQGVNRVSIGVQSMNANRLQFMGRRQTVVDNRRAVSLARRAGVRNISVDYIYGIPADTVDRIEQDVKQLCELGPDHVSAYELTVAPGTWLALQRKQLCPGLPNDEQMVRLWETVGQVLSTYGFQRYEISNWARTGMESLHNLNYWRGGPYLGVGAGAHGFVHLPDGWVRYANSGIVDDYLEERDDLTGRWGVGMQGWDESLTSMDVAREIMMLGLRCREGISRHRLWPCLNEAAQVRFAAELERLVRDGYLLAADDRWIPTDRGMMLADTLAVRFF